MKMNQRSMKGIKLLAAAAAIAAAGFCYSCTAGSQPVPLEGETRSEQVQTAEETELQSTASSEEAPESREEHTETSQDEEEKEQPVQQPLLFVHVCGQVRFPGVYQLEPGSRVYQAIQMAGGGLEDSAQDYLNLALEVEDGMRIQVPSVQETVQWKETGRTGIDLGTGGSGTGAGPGETLENKVNLNTATREELMTLSGIGPSRADDIIRYRDTYGPFRQIEDIMNISGIKEAAFQKIKDSITV